MGWGKTLIGPPTKTPPHKSLKFQTVVTRFPTCASIKFLKKRHKFLDWARRLTLSKNCNHFKCGEFQQFYFRTVGQGCLKNQKVEFKISTLVFPSTWHVRSLHKTFQPSRPTRTPSAGYLYFQQRMSKENTFKFTDWSYLSPSSKIKKIEGTLFPSTFKV